MRLTDCKAIAIDAESGTPAFFKSLLSAAWLCHDPASLHSQQQPSSPPGEAEHRSSLLAAPACVPVTARTPSLTHLPNPGGMHPAAFSSPKHSGWHATDVPTHSLTTALGLR